MTDDRHGIGGNNPPSEEDEFTAALEAKHVSLLSRRNELTLAGERAPEEINDEATAKKAADFLKQIIAHENSVEKERKVAKAPHFKSRQVGGCVFQRHGREGHEGPEGADGGSADRVSATRGGRGAPAP